MLRFVLLVYAALFRQPLRTALTVLSVATAFVIFGLLQGFMLGFHELVENNPDEHLQVVNRTMSAGLFTLPISHARAIEQMEGVASVVTITWFSGYFQEPTKPVGGFAISDIGFLRENSEFYQIEPGIYADFERLRTGAIVGRELALEHGWEVGDQVPVVGPPKADGTDAWFLDIVGLWHNDTQEFEARQVILHFDFVEEGRAAMKGQVANLIVLADGSLPSATLSAEIDASFLNSSFPTRTASFRTVASTQLDQVGEVQFYVNGIVGGALFIILIATGGTMAQSVRDRQPEFAVLRSVGFRSWLIAILVVCEALIICAVGALVGLAVSYFASPAVFAYIDFMTYVELPASVFGYGLAASAVLGLVSMVVPLTHLYRLNTVDALAGR